jgi:hypothetical protein
MMSILGLVSSPPTPDEWFRVNRYMGLLEIMQVNIEEGLLDAKTTRWRRTP